MIEVETEQSATATMVVSANEQLTDLQGKLDELNQRLEEADAELAAIADARAERIQRLEKAQTLADMAGADYDQATSYARLSHDTSNERQAVQAAASKKKVMQAAKRDLETLTSEIEGEDQAAQAREQELRRQVQQQNAEKTKLEAQVADVSRGHTQAFAELGEERYAALVQMYQAKRKEAEALREQMVQVQIALETLHETALHDLAEWPHFQEQIVQLGRPRSDATVRAILAALAYVEVMLEEAPAVNNDWLTLPALKSALYGGGNVWDVIAVPPNEVFAARSSKYFLSQRQQCLQQLLDQYRERFAVPLD